MEKSRYLVSDIQVIGAVTQPIVKIPLRDIQEIGLFASVPTLLDHIIIGPSQYPLAIAEAFQQLLTEAGVPESEKKIRVSDIPLRR